ncbi:DUF6127 family protein [Paracoccus fistulariae]|nr:D-Ala-D-Ala carboxypeptidase family metallohydrolase [Paracoccus fistulariae]MDB6183170.1 DUF6127 family protein [Paracoccus fistulariae]
MAPQRPEDGFVRMPEHEFEAILARAAEEGAKRALNEPALDKLQALRNRLGKPLIVRSAYRSPEHNRAVGGAMRSKHMDGAAFDIAIVLIPEAWDKLNDQL